MRRLRVCEVYIKVAILGGCAKNTLIRNAEIKFVTIYKITKQAPTQAGGTLFLASFIKQSDPQLGIGNML